jgi:ParB-like chromosome segregation protein Spo0J
MDIQLFLISEIILYDRNPRRPGRAVEKTDESIRAFGWRQPIVIDEHMAIVVGHTRLLAAKALGLATVPVHIARDLSPEQIKAYGLADNRTGEEADWDDDLLKLEIGDLDIAGFDLRLTGFDYDELARIRLAGNEGLTDPDDIPEPPANPVTRLGDCWLLGNHRLVCGDSTNAATVEKALAGTRPHLMVTDPPY